MEDNTTNTETVVDTDPQIVEQTTEPTKTISKDLFDKTASELASANKVRKELEKKLLEIENASKTTEQIKADELAQLELKLKAMNENLAKAKVTSIVAEAKAKILLDGNDNGFDDVLNVVTGDSEDIAEKNGTALNKLLLAVYEQGKKHALSGEHSKMSSGIKNGSNNKNTDYENYLKSKIETKSHVDLKK